MPDNSLTKMHTTNSSNNQVSHRQIFRVNDPDRRSQWVWQRFVAGEKVRTFFPSLREALEAKRNAEAEIRRNGGDSRRIFDLKAQREYDAAKRICGDEISIVDACLFWSRNKEEQPRRVAKIPEAVEEVLANLEKRGTTAEYFKTTRFYLRKFARAFAKRTVSDVRGHEILKWVASLNLAPSSANVVVTKIASFFKRAQALDYITRAPLIDRAALPKQPPIPVSAYSTAETASLLDFIAQNYPQFLANFALRAFVGFRTTEASKMRWEYIDEENQRITIPAQVSKTRQNFLLTDTILPPTIFRWLAAIPKSQKTDEIHAPEQRFFETLIKTAPCGWKKNVLRHTFATMHISLIGDASKTALILRHRSPQMLYKHYLAAIVPKAEAEAFFALNPPKNRL